MSPGRLPFVAAALALASFGACGGKGKGAGKPEKLDDTLGGLVVPAIDDSLCDTKGKRVETYDLNRDQRPDVWKVFAQVTERGVKTEVLTCKQIDFDKDGIKDYVVTYRENGRMITEEADLTFDGRFDSRHHFDKKSSDLYLVERDIDHDKKPDVWETYDDKGRLETVRRDTNGDSKPDIWEQYIDGELIAILYDDDYDNRVDRKEQVKLPAPVIPPPNSEPLDDEPDGAEPDGADPAKTDAGAKPDNEPAKPAKPAKPK